MDNDQNVINEEQQGTITFANEVLATIVGVAACDIPGVAGMCGGFKDGFVNLLGKKNFSKGVKTSLKDGKVLVELAIVVNYGVSVPNVCKNIQESVKNALETMTGLGIYAININVEGISFDGQNTASDTEA